MDLGSALAARRANIGALAGKSVLEASPGHGCCCGCIADPVERWTNVGNSVAQF
jgi:hypothetical protein